MKIAGFERFSMVDYNDKMACVLFLWGCNFRCGFCHNPELVTSNSVGEYSEQEVLDFLEIRKGQLDAICITGGEPLMSLNKEFLKEIKQLGYLIKIDTNGSFPEKLQELISENLIDYIAMDIKTVPEKYKEVCGSGADVEKIEKSIKIISGFPAYEFRTTIVESLHNENTVLEIAKWLNKICEKKPRHYALQGFKNQGKLIDNEFKKEDNVSEIYLRELGGLVKDYFEKVEIRR